MFTDDIWEGYPCSTQYIAVDEDQVGRGVSDAVQSFVRLLCLIVDVMPGQ